MGRSIYDPLLIFDGILEARHWASPRRHVWIWDDFFYATSPTQLYEIEGTFASINTEGGAIQLTTGALAGNRSRANLIEASKVFNPARDLIGGFRTGPVSTLQIRLFAGFFSALPTAAEPSVEPADGLYFRAVAAGAAANLFAVSRKAAVETAVDTGVAWSGGMKALEIEVIGAIAKFFIDGVLKATITTNVPTANLFAGFVLTTREAVAKNFGIDCLQVYNKRFGAAP